MYMISHVRRYLEVKYDTCVLQLLVSHGFTANRWVNPGTIAMTVMTLTQDTKLRINNILSISAYSFYPYITI